MSHGFATETNESEIELQVKEATECSTLFRGLSKIKVREQQRWLSPLRCSAHSQRSSTEQIKVCPSQAPRSVLGRWIHSLKHRDLDAAAPTTSVTAFATLAVAATATANAGNGLGRCTHGHCHGHGGRRNDFGLRSQPRPSHLDHRSGGNERRRRARGGTPHSLSKRSSPPGWCRVLVATVALPKSSNVSVTPVSSRHSAAARGAAAAPRSARMARRVRRGGWGRSGGIFSSLVRRSLCPEAENGPSD